MAFAVGRAAFRPVDSAQVFPEAAAGSLDRASAGSAGSDVAGFLDRDVVDESASVRKWVDFRWAEPASLAVASAAAFRASVVQAWRPVEMGSPAPVAAWVALAVARCQAGLSAACNRACCRGPTVGDWAAVSPVPAGDSSVDDNASCLRTPGVRYRRSDVSGTRSSEDDRGFPSLSTPCGCSSTAAMSNSIPTPSNVVIMTWGPPIPLGVLMLTTQSWGWMRGLSFMTVAS